MDEKGKTFTTNCKFEKWNNKKKRKYIWLEKTKETDEWLWYYNSKSVDTNWARPAFLMALFVKNKIY